MITVELKGLDKALSHLSRQSVARAASLAINEAARQTRTEASRAIRQKFNLSSARVNKEVRNIKLSTRANLTAVVSAQGRPVGLTNFGAKWVRNVGGVARTTTAKKSTVGKRTAKLQGVTVRIERGKTTRLSHAFLGRGRVGRIDAAGSLHVFQRKPLSDPKAGLVSMSTITIASMMNQKRVVERLVKKAGDVLERRFLHHLGRMV